MRFYYSKDQFLYYSNKTIINFSYYFYYYYFNNIKHFIQTALFLPDDSNRSFLRRKIIKNMTIPLLTLLNYKKKKKIISQILIDNVLDVHNDRNVAIIQQTYTGVLRK